MRAGNGQGNRTLTATTKFPEEAGMSRSLIIAQAGSALLAVTALPACPAAYQPPPPAPALAGPLPPSAPSSPPLSPAQDQALVSGNTISGIAENGEPYFAF